jgi:hypothetical protein
MENVLLLVPDCLALDVAVVGDFDSDDSSASGLRFTRA